MIAYHAEFAGMNIAVGDYLFRGHEVGVVIACCHEADTLSLVVNAHRKVADISERNAAWVAEGARVVWKVDEVKECCAWQVAAGGHVVALQF